MLIVCPSCAASYRIADGSLGAKGRTVRCASCKTTWFANPEDALPDVAPPALAAEAEVPETVAAGAGSRAEAPAPKLRGIDIAVKERPPARAAAAAQDVEPATERRRPPRTRERTWRMPRMRPMMLLALGGVMALAALAVRRDDAAAFVPEIAPLFEAIGLPVNVRGLAFREVKTVEQLEGGAPVLIVTGTIVNVSRKPQPVPRLRLAVLAPGEREIYVWSVVASVASLQPGETVPFRAQLAAPAAEGRQISVRFLTKHDATFGVGQKAAP